MYWCFCLWVFCFLLSDWLYLNFTELLFSFIRCTKSSKSFFHLLTEVAKKESTVFRQNVKNIQYALNNFFVKTIFLWCKFSGHPVFVVRPTLEIKGVVHIILNIILNTIKCRGVKTIFIKIFHFSAFRFDWYMYKKGEKNLPFFVVH